MSEKLRGDDVNPNYLKRIDRHYLQIRQVSWRAMPSHPRNGPPSKTVYVACRPGRCGLLRQTT